MAGSFGGGTLTVAASLVPELAPCSLHPNQTGLSHVLQLVLQVGHVLGDQRQGVIHAHLDQCHLASGHHLLERLLDLAN